MWVAIPMVWMVLMLVGVGQITMVSSNEPVYPMGYKGQWVWLSLYRSLPDMGRHGSGSMGLERAQVYRF